ncbi:MAG TPA: hypothetical protein VNI01_10695 [Elusimicrobiota bacterium]|jgi:hypothetical protein|nr:hypothetical protein [Elusimicrobiota bacterium]
MLAILLAGALLPAAARAAEPKPYDDLARALAGMPQKEDGSLAALAKEAAWVEHAKVLSADWTKLEKARLAPMRSWAAAEIPASTRTLFYPFSGPDFLTAQVFFPKAPSYVLFALEPVGTLPDLKTSSGTALSGYLESVQESLADLFKRSYFRTRRMRTELGKEGTNGVLPVLLVFAARAGLSIEDVKAVEIEKDGALSESAWEKAKSPRGVKVSLRDAGGRETSLYYFSADISDAGLKRHAKILAYIRSLTHVDTYLKSASYLLHTDDFSKVRDAVLADSDRVLQDDSGLAYRAFDRARWDVRLYGTYERPIEEFPSILEPDLEEAYLTAKPKPVPFSLGYHWGKKRGTNLLFAVRKP